MANVSFSHSQQSYKHQPALAWTIDGQGYECTIVVLLANTLAAVRALGGGEEPLGGLACNGTGRRVVYADDPGHDVLLWVSAPVRLGAALAAVEAVIVAATTIWQKPSAHET